MGAINIGMGSKEEVHSFLVSNQFSLVATSGKSEISFWNREFSPKIAFIFGSEKEGLGRFWTDRSVDLIKIPMKGSADSLNLHASAACILAEYNRRGGS
jgi:tRNA G18 (ribose-2'-O)-methylase SpoU